ARERSLEARQVGATLVGVDVVDEGERVLGVAVVVLERQLDLRFLPAGLDVDRLGMQRLAAPAQVRHELDDAALVEELLLARPSLAPLIRERDQQPAVEEGELA